MKLSTNTKPLYSRSVGKSGDVDVFLFAVIIVLGAADCCTDQSC